MYKLHPPARYSEEIDHGQTKTEPAGTMFVALRDALDPWLGKQRQKQTERRVTFVYMFDSEMPLPLPLRLKVETNAREHFSVHGLKQLPLHLDCLVAPLTAGGSRSRIIATRSALRTAASMFLTSWELSDDRVPPNENNPPTGGVAHGSASRKPGHHFDALVLHVSQYARPERRVVRVNTTARDALAIHRGDGVRDAECGRGQGHCGDTYWTRRVRSIRDDLLPDRGIG